MRSEILRTAMVTSLVTALAVSALAFYAMPKLQTAEASEGPVTLQPTQVAAPQVAATMRTQAVRRTQPVAYRESAYQQPVYRDTAYQAPVSPTSSANIYDDTAVQQGRSKKKSVAIVAGSAAAGAAIGALAKGGKGAAIGAIAGGVGGFIYDRATANK